MSCDSSACIHVEVAANGYVHIWTDTDKSTGSSEFARATRQEWVAFVAGIKAGEFDNLENQNA